MLQYSMFCCSPGGLLVAFVVYWWSLWSLLRGPPTSILVRWPARGPRCVRGCGAGVREVLADLRWHTTITESTKSSALRNSPCNADGFVMFHPAAKPRQWAYFAINYAFCQKAAASWGPETLASPTTVRFNISRTPTQRNVRRHPCQLLRAYLAPQRKDPR